MEAALRRRLRERLKHDLRGLQVTLLDDGGVSISQGTKSLGVWHWRHGVFEFIISGEDKASIKAHTLIGASVHTLLLLEKVE